MDQATYAIISLVLLGIGGVICFDDIMRRPQPSCSDQFIIGVLVLVGAILIGAS